MEMCIQEINYKQKVVEYRGNVMLKQDLSEHYFTRAWAKRSLWTVCVWAACSSIECNIEQNVTLLHFAHKLWIGEVCMKMAGNKYEFRRCVTLCPRFIMTGNTHDKVWRVQYVWGACEVSPRGGWLCSLRAVYHPQAPILPGFHHERWETGIWALWFGQRGCRGC